MAKSKTISIIIPVYNESENIPLIHAALTDVVGKLDYDIEIVFVDDGSRDRSLELVQGLATKDKRVKVVGLSRNFGKEIATTAGLHNCTGDAAIMLDADLQHPVELIPEFVAKWEDGFDVVVGVRHANRGEGAIKRIGSRIFYKMLNSITDTPILPGSTDYRLINRVVIDEFNRFTERNRMTRGLIDWLGFKRDYIFYTANPRAHGTPGYSVFKLTRLAINSFVSLSLFPLKVAGYLGIFVTVPAGLLGLFIFTHKFILRTPLGLSISGPDMLAVILLFMIGIVLVSLGLIALYIANIHSEVINRPIYVVATPKDGHPRK